MSGNYICLRPVYHFKDDRIRFHVLLCRLALLLVRIAEVETGITWPKIRREMQRLHIEEFLSKKRVFYSTPNLYETSETY